MTTANEVLKIARGEIGYRVGRGRPSKYGEWYGEAGFSTAAWCAMFVSWCFATASMPLPAIQNKKGFAYCPFGLRWFKHNGKLKKNPQIGDIVFFDWGKDGVADHVGIVESVYPTYIKTIEGNTSVTNQSNGGEVMRRVRYYPSCCGFARPDYEEHSNEWNGFYLEIRDPLTQRVEVGIVQILLTELGYKLEVDNIYGKQTAKAVRDYQRKNGLEIDGVVGPDTWSNLHR